MRKPCIYFFDSVGEKEPEEITEFVEKVKEQGDKNGIVLTYFWYNNFLINLICTVLYKGKCWIGNASVSVIKLYF